MEYILNAGVYEDLKEKIRERKKFIISTLSDQHNRYSLSENKRGFFNNTTPFDYGSDIANDFILGDLYEQLEALIMKVDKWGLQPNSSVKLG